VVNNVCTRVAVMYSGKIVELANTEEFFSAPKHPYSQTLLASLLAPDPKMRNRERTLPKGEPPSPIDPPPACRFAPRCSYAMRICSQKEPALAALSETREVACFLYHERIEGE